MNRLLICSLSLALSLAMSAETPLWLRNAQISPDGSKIAFTYKGDIYTVDTHGGEARRLTTSTSYETRPVWSADASKIAFASDRHGNFDIFIMDANGGNPTRLTTHSAAETPELFSPDGTRIYYTANIQQPTGSAYFPSSRNTQLFSVGIDGSTPRMEIGSPMQSLAFLPDGRSFLFQDLKGFENEWRKHHTSSVTRDIWRYDAAEGTFTNLTDRPGEDRNPVVSPDGTTVYFLSERDGGSFNIYAAPIDDMAAATPLTRLERHPVRHLSGASDGTLAFTYNGEIYTLAPGAAEPQKVAVSITADDTPQRERITVTGRGGVPSPDGSQVAYTARGEVFVGSTKHESVKQITNTPAAEKEIAWHPEGRQLVYTSLRDGHYNLYTARIVRDDDPNFSNATLIEETPLVAADSIERTVAKYSPDGSQIAFIEGRHRLMVMDTSTKAVRELTDGSNYAYSDGSYDYEWSPDGKWITFAYDGNGHSPYTDIALLEVATGKITFLTRSGYTDHSPRFVMNGNAILYLTECYGMRSHASWGSQDDAVLVFLNRDAADRFRLSEEDYELRKEAEKANKKGSDDDGKDKKKGKKDEENASEATTDIVVELDGIENRRVRVTPFSSDLAGAYVDPEGRKIWFLAAVEQGYDLWEMEFEDSEPSIAARLDMQYAEIIPSKDGSTLYIMGDKMKKFDTASSSVKGISSSAKLDLDHAAEREAMFDQVYLSEREMFYVDDLHGVDWDGLAADYRRFLPHINNNRDFAEMLSELLGELNVSHTGASFRGNDATDPADATPSLGLLYDMTFTGEGMKVDEILPEGPFDSASTRLRPGMIITTVNTTPIAGAGDFSLLNNLVGKKTLVGFTDPASGETFEEVVIPVSQGSISDILYRRWVEKRAADVDRWSDGRLGYVHIESMDDESFRKVYSDLLGKYLDREGVVVDIRWNGGGRLHEDVEILLSGNRYFEQVVRGNPTCEMPSRRYNKPSIMVMAEPCYSNAHGTPWVYKNRGLGRLVGMPVPGTMTSVNWVRLQDPSLVFGIPVVGYRLPDGGYLENRQLEPDVKVVSNPAEMLSGEDAQLHRAVTELLREIDAAKP